MKCANCNGQLLEFYFAFGVYVCNERLGNLKLARQIKNEQEEMGEATEELK